MSLVNTKASIAYIMSAAGRYIIFHRCQPKVRGTCTAYSSTKKVD